MPKFAMSLAILMIAVCAGPALAQSSPPSTLDVVKQRGTLQAGIRKDYPPAGFVDKNGAWAGFEYELGAYFAEKLGVKYAPVEAGSRTRIPLLLNGNIDFVMNTMNPTIERADVIDFSMPYFMSGQRILVKKGSGITGLDSLAGRKVAGVQGSNDVQVLLAVQPKVVMQYYQQWPETFLALKNGQVDAISTVDFVLTTMTGNDPQYEFVGPELNYAPWVIGVRQNDSKWRLAIDKLVMEAWVDGTYAKIYAKYFSGPIPFKLPLWPDYIKRQK